MNMHVKEITFGVRPPFGAEIELIISMKNGHETWLIPLCHENPNWNFEHSGFKPKEQWLPISKKDCYRILNGTEVEETGKEIRLSHEEKMLLKEEIFRTIAPEIYIATCVREEMMFEFFKIPLDKLENLSDEERKKYMRWVSI